MRRLALALALTALPALAGCAPTLSQPFASLGTATVTIYRLQNVEPTAAQQAPGAVTFQIPKEVQQLISGAAALLPPGLIPPGLIPGTPPAAPPTAQDLRFRGFRVISWQTISDPAQKTEVLDILGHGSNFGPLQSTCMYAEFGFAIQPAPGAPTDDVLVSLSCGQVQAFNFTWPYATTGITGDAAKRIVAVATKTFGAPPLATPPSGT
jgi:hypothetical protein